MHPSPSQPPVPSYPPFVHATPPKNKKCTNKQANKQTKKQKNPKHRKPLVAEAGACPRVYVPLFIALSHCSG